MHTAQRKTGGADDNKASERLAPWYRSLVIALRGIALIAAVYQFLFGDAITGFFIVLATAAIMAPGAFTRNHIKSVPLELELIFFAMVVLQFVIGDTLNFYGNVPYYDKFVHFSLPFFIGLIAFLLAYTLHRVRKLSIATGPLVLLIVLITIGIGAIWEIIEYMIDIFLVPNISWLGPTQGSLTEPPLDDTMYDLIFDLLGGIFGALLALRYIRTSSKKRNSRLSSLIREIANSFSRK